MTYNPMFYNPGLYNPSTYSNTQPVNGLIKIESIEGAQMYQLPPNSVSPPLFLSEENAFIVKTTDGGGAASLKKYSFKEEPMTNNKNDEFVTREYFDEKMNNILEAINGKHSIPKQSIETNGQLASQSIPTT
jgi:hypothetical protein